MAEKGENPEIKILPAEMEAQESRMKIEGTDASFGRLQPVGIRWQHQRW